MLHGVMELQNRFLFKRNGNLYFLCKFIDSRLSPAIVKRSVKVLPNLPVFWRHQTPQKEEFSHQPVFGRVLSAVSLLKGGGAAVIKLYGGSNMPYVDTKRKALIRLVEEAIAKGYRIGLSLTYDSVEKNGRTLEAEPIEVSVTPWPACNTCVIEMEDEEKVEETIKEKVEEVLEDADVDELVELLNEKTLELEKTRSELEEIKDEASTAKEALSKEKVSLSKRMEKLENTLLKQATTIKELEKSKKFLENEVRDPLKETILKTTNLFEEEELDKMSICDLKKKAALCEARDAKETAIQVTSMEHTVEENQEEPEETLKDALIKKRESCEEGSEMYEFYTEKLKELESGKDKIINEIINRYGGE